MEVSEVHDFRRKSFDQGQVAVRNFQVAFVNKPVNEGWRTPSKPIIRRRAMKGDDSAISLAFL
jgi:hypothetical protein